MLNKVLDYIKNHKILAIISALLVVILILSLSFYSSATLKNYSSLTVALAVIAIVLYIAGICFDSKGLIPLANIFLTGFCFGYYLTSRLESLNLIQVNLSDINQYFYIDLVFWIIAFVGSIAYAVLDTFLKKEKALA